MEILLTSLGILTLVHHLTSMCLEINGIQQKSCQQLSIECLVLQRKNTCMTLWPDCPNATAIIGIQ